MAIEREIKFPVEDFSPIKDKLKEIGAIFIEKYFEKNIVFDDSKNSLRSKKILLRLRQKKEKNILCLKCPSNDMSSDHIKVLEEYETEIKDRKNFIIILSKLGFIESFRYEKVREIWRFEKIIICLDILPFGDYVEIEGNGDLMNFALKLGLDVNLATNKTYHELNSYIRKINGLSPCDSFIFEDWKKAI